jgi:alpha,alpha-trehalase
MILTVLCFVLGLSVFASSLEMEKLIKEEDTDGDKKITILDKGDGVFVFKGKEIKGHYHLSNLLQELTLQNENPLYKIEMDKISENPVDRVSRMISDYSWQELTRAFNEDDIERILPDSKVDTGSEHYLYIPKNDKRSFETFTKIASKRKDLNLRVERLQTSKNYSGKHGLLSLELNTPYVVPGGRFNEMYGWDSYFESIGLKLDKKEWLVESMIRNFTYEIENYGKILNANRTYYLSRSQPPFFTSMIRLIPKGKWPKDAVMAAMKEYETVWMGPERLTSTGLSRYYGKNKEIPPEVEAGHFYPILEPFAKKLGLKVSDYQDKYQKGEIIEKELDTFFEHDACVRESGHDTTYRFRMNGKDACADFVTVDLNVLLYKMEMDLYALITKYFGGSLNGKKAIFYKKRAERRKLLIQKYLWDEKIGFFFDYHVPTRKRSTYISATGLYPLMISEGKLLTNSEAKRVVTFGLSKLEAPGGIYASAKESRVTGDSYNRQWDWPNGWAPHQMILWQGLLNFGFKTEAERLIMKWLQMITENARDYNGTIPEKFDVEKRSHAVFAEYGNVGTEFSYITKEGFGWMNASFQYGLHLLSPAAKNELRKKVVK